jgi:CheY-like chemotaxis protein
MSPRKSIPKPSKNDQQVTDLAHDLNNLLVGIVGNAQLLEEDVASPQLPLVRQIITCANRAAGITQILLKNDGVTGLALVPEQDQDQEEQPPLKQSRTSEAPVASSRLQVRDTVLVIDDEEVVRSISAAVLSRAGYRALVASNGPEGLRLFESNKKRIISVFLDLTMPYMRGNLVFARLKAIDEAVHVYLMSGYSDQQALYEFDTQEIRGFIQKPFQNEDILLAVERSEELLQQNRPDAIAGNAAR